MPSERREVVLLAGGTGGAKLATGLRDLLPPGALTVVTNPGDDLDIWGLRVCPDTDAVLFRLAGIFNQLTGYGIAGDSSAVLDQLTVLGEDVWFHLGDRDLAFHLLRTELLRQGRRLTQVMLELGRRLGVSTRVLPATDQAVRTTFRTDEGRLGFQDYFVRRRLQPALRGIDFEGLETAHLSPEAESALRGADLIVIGPSNPLISIEPILRLAGDAVDPRRSLAVTPVVGGRALKGPTVEMLRTLRGTATPAAVAREYRERASWFVLDRVDSAAAADVAEVGLRPLVLDTVMADEAGSRRLAGELLAATAGMGE